MSETGRIRWLCRRGMKELDVLLERFYRAEFEALSAAEVSAFRGLLEHEDPDLYALLLGSQPPADPVSAGLAERIREYRRVV
ncbi:MAG: succinate dehydrogenase assembly factor 2 [Salinisphaeraceae bacterium]